MDKNSQRNFKAPVEESLDRNEIESRSFLRIIDAMLIQQKCLMNAQMDKLTQLLYNNTTGQRLEDLQTPQFLASWKSKELREIQDITSRLKESTSLLKRKKEYLLHHLIDEADGDESIQEESTR